MLTTRVLGRRGGGFPTAIKAALGLQGVCEAWPAKPLPPLDHAARAGLHSQLSEWGLLARSSESAAG